MKTSYQMQSGCRSRIQGLTRQSGGTPVRVEATPRQSVKTLRRGLPFTLIELAVLAAGFGAFAALMTSCSSSAKKGTGALTAADSEPISTGLDRLLDPKSKQPKLNSPAEITKDSDYQKLADQAKVDYENLFNREKAPKEPSTNAGPAKSGLKDLTAGKSEPLIALPEPEPAAVVPEPVKTMPVVEPAPVTVIAEPVKSEQAAAPTTNPAAQVVAPEAKVIAAEPPPAPVFKGANALLAARVSGFGRYVPLPSRPGRGTYVFQSARANRAIVYVEIENFGYRPVKDGDPDVMPGDQWAVDLSTEIQLLDAYDGMLQMKEAERGVIETGRNKRKDFYLVQEIELPPTLTIGSYNLKLVLKDRSSADPIRTEMIIPIQIVGDLAAIMDN